MDSDCIPRGLATGKINEGVKKHDTDILMYRALNVTIISVFI